MLDSEWTSNGGQYPIAECGRVWLYQATHLDGIGATTFDSDLKAPRTRGNLVIVATASGPVPAVDVNTLNTSGSLFLTRPTVVDHVRTPEEVRSRTDEIFEWIRSGDLKIDIGDRFPLTEVAAAFTALESRATTGKIILEH